MHPALASSAISSADDATAELIAALRGYEDLLDDAFSAGGRLAQALVNARRSRHLAAIIGHQAWSAISRSQSTLATARSEVVLGHRHLDRAAQQLGIDISMFGDMGKGPEATFFTSATTGAEAIS